MRRHVPCVLAASLLAACAVEPPQPATPAPASAPAMRARTTAGELLGYLGRLRNMAEPALAAEASRQRRLMQRDASDVARVKAALALALAQPADDTELAALVEPIAKRDGADADLRSMASFLQVLAAERRRQRESAAAANARLREERRVAETHKQRADALQERATQLQQKLDALTEIEKSLSDRPNPR